MRMTKSIKVGAVALALVTTWQFVGCGGILPQVTVPVQLGNSAAFNVEPGVPETKIISATFDTGDVTVGSGSVAVDPSVMSINRNSAKTTQAVEGCATACEAAGVGTAQCDQICTDGEVHVIVRVAGGGEEETVCTDGDRYPPVADANAYRVTIANDVPTSVTPDSVSFQQGTVNAFNAGAATFCVTVVAGFSGEVILDELTLSAGL